MVAFDEFPDIESAIASELRSTLGCGVYSSVPNAPTFPFVKLQRIGGLPAERHRLDRARLQVSVFGRNQSSAYDLAAAARAAIFSLEGAATGGAIVTGVDDDLGMMFSPDPETKRDRYIFGVSVYFHRDDAYSSSS